MKRTPLKRKTPLRNSGTGLKRTAMKRSCVRIAPRSERRAAEEKLYAQARKEYLSAHPQCEFPGCARSLLRGDLIDLHHKAGRNGPLLYCQEYFAALCRPHHNYVEEHLSWSRAQGWILDLTTEQVRALRDN